MHLNSLLLTTIIIILMSSTWLPVSSTSWVKILNKQTVLESDLHISYKIDQFDSSRFNDIHSLLYAGSALLYAIRMPGGEGTLSIPCGVITHAGTHSITISYTNNTVIATTQFGVAWPLMAVTVPHRIETYTMDVVVRVSFTKNLCNPISPSGNNNNQRVLQGGKEGLVTVWLKVEKCNTKACDDNKVMHIAKLENFYSSHSSKMNIQCRDWGVEGIFRVIIGAEIEEQRGVLKSDSVIARSKIFYVDWSSEYDLSTNRVAVEPCGEGDSLVVEMNYPACILDMDKIRLHQETGHRGSGKRKYIGEQRVIPGDKAVIFPCSAFNKTSSDDMFCFSYVSTAGDGSVATLLTTCLPYQDPGRQDRGRGWEGWSSWSECSTSCGQGVQTRYRFCVSDSYPGGDSCQGARVESRHCKIVKCTSTSIILTTSSISTPPPPRPTSVYGASPCACGCTYILYPSGENHEDIPSTDIHIVTGICPGLPISWTMKVPSIYQMIFTFSNVSLSCSSLNLNLRDGLLPTDTILYQVISTSAVSVKIQSSSNILRLELQADDPDTNLTSCFAVLNIRIQHAGYSHDHPQQASFFKSEMAKVLKLSTPILLVISLSVLMVICTLIMLVDYQIKKVKYTNWKARPTSGYSTPTGGCQSYTLVEDIHTSLSTISDYVPLIMGHSMENIKAEMQLSKSVPATPARPRRRRLLKRSETLGESKMRLKNKRKFSLPSKVSKSKLYMSIDTIDGEDDIDEYIKESSDKLAEIQQQTTKMKKVVPKRRKNRFTSSTSTAAASSESDLPRTGSELTLKPTQSVSEFSCISADQELEYDLYDCHLDNAMAAPGSLFAPAYWDGDTTPTLELELEQLFQGVASENHKFKEYNASEDVIVSDDKFERSIPSTSPVMLRSGKSGRKPLISSITSDLTASISSAISDSTLVGDHMDTSCYYSGEEESMMTTSFLLKNEKRDIMNLTHIEEIQFVDE